MLYQTNASYVWMIPHLIHTDIYADDDKCVFFFTLFE